MPRKITMIAFVLWAMPSYADSTAENILNGLLDLTHDALLNGGNIEARVPNVIEGAEVTHVYAAGAWPIPINDPLGINFGFQIHLENDAELATLSFNCTKFGAVSYRFFAESGFVGEDDFGASKIPFEWLTVAGSAYLPDVWPENAAAMFSCLGSSFSEGGVSPFSTDDLRAFFEAFKNEDDISRRSWPTMMVGNVTYHFDIRSDIEYPSHRITQLRVAFPDSFVTLVEIRGHLLNGSS